MAKKLPYSQRARSIPHKPPFVWSVLWIALYYVFLVMALTAGTIFCIEVYLSPEIPKTLAFIMVGCIGATTLVWLIGYFTRKGAICSLCRATPYFENGATFHVKAEKTFPFNYSHTNFMKSVFLQRFRCQYCGTPYDYRKKHVRR